MHQDAAEGRISQHSECQGPESGQVADGAEPAPNALKLAALLCNGRLGMDTADVLQGHHQSRTWAYIFVTRKLQIVLQALEVQVGCNNLIRKQPYFSMGHQSPK